MSAIRADGRGSRHTDPAHPCGCKGGTSASRHCIPPPCAEPSYVEVMSIIPETEHSPFKQCWAQNSHIAVLSILRHAPLKFSPLRTDSRRAQCGVFRKGRFACAVHIRNHSHVAVFCRPYDDTWIIIHSGKYINARRGKNVDVPFQKYTWHFGDSLKMN